MTCLTCDAPDACPCEVPLCAACAIELDHECTPPSTPESPTGRLLSDDGPAFQNIGPPLTAEQRAETVRIREAICPTPPLLAADFKGLEERLMADPLVRPMIKGAYKGREVLPGVWVKEHWDTGPAVTREAVSNYLEQSKAAGEIEAAVRARLSADPSGRLIGDEFIVELKGDDNGEA